MDKWDADVRALLDRFRFLPAWRIDDVMISFATPGGSVGPHVDQYDVFLLQAQGQRRWQIDADPRAPRDFRPDVETEAAADNSSLRTTGCSSPATCCTCRPACRTTAKRWMPA
jgi:50S ribosomal protein L16 3-hydroxylase